MSNYQAILIPCEGVYRNGQLPEWTMRRLDRAVARHNSNYLIPLRAGSLYKPPPLDESGFPITSAGAAANYLVNNGVEPRWIFIESSSYDTIGSAFFSRMLHTDPRGLRRLLVITSEHHLPRTQAVFDWVFQLDAPPRPYVLDYEAVSDTGIDIQALTIRRRKEVEGLQRWLITREHLNDLAALHTWLFSEHTGYSPSISRPQNWGTGPLDPLYLD